MKLYRRKIKPCLDAWRSWFSKCILCGKLILPFQSKFKHEWCSNNKRGYAHFSCMCELLCECDDETTIKEEEFGDEL